MPRYRVTRTLEERTYIDAANNEEALQISYEQDEDWILDGAERWAEEDEER